MDIITYALAKKLAAAAVSGISNLQVNGTNLVITTNDGQTLTMNFPTPQDGISIADVTVNDNNHLICILTDGNEIDAGIVPTIDGKTPVKGVDYMTKDDIQYIVTEAQKPMELEFF